ncbi:MAG: AraC family transcriptional regulator [Propionibacteriaceae bacterium]|nr:AraC family transcriptional regulator [Propionibacteriaceae bacterium]
MKLSESIAAYEVTFVERILGPGSAQALGLEGHARAEVLSRLWSRIAQLHSSASHLEPTSGGSHAGRGPTQVRADIFLSPGQNLGYVFHSLENPLEIGPLHAHDYFELSYVYYGSAAHHLSHSTERLEAGESVMVRPYVRHEMRIEPGSCVINLVIRPQLLSRMLSTAFAETGEVANYLSGYFSAIAGTSDRLLFAPVNLEEQRQVMEQIVEEIERKELGYEAKASALLLTLLVDWARQTSRASDEPEQVRLLTAIIGHIADNFAAVSLNSLARRFGFSASHLSRFLKQHTGKGFAKIVLDYKLDHALAMVETSDLLVSQIAKHVGFGSASHFTQVFRGRFGMTPSACRAKIRQS